MKPPVEQALEKKTVQQAIETIRDRVDYAGRERAGDSGVRPGRQPDSGRVAGHFDDLDRVKSIIQSTARLEIHAVVGGPYQDEQEALASVGGTLPPDEELVHGSGALATGSDADSVYVLQRVPVVAGSDFRSADPGTEPDTGCATFTLP